MSLQNKTVIITGAGGDIGSHAVAAFLAEGANVVAADIDVAKAQAAVEGKSGIAVKTDVTSLEDNKKLVQAAIDRFGRLDVIVCNAGITIVGEIEEITVANFEKTENINFFGVYNLIKAAAPVLEEDGAIVMTASKAAKRSVQGMSQYAASKLAMFGLAQSLAYELGERKIRVNCVCPGDLVAGPMWQSSLIHQLGAKFGMSAEEMFKARTHESPLHRFCYAQDIANAMVFLADGEKSGYTTASNIDCTGGVCVN